MHFCAVRAREEIVPTQNVQTGYGEFQGFSPNPHIFNEFKPRGDCHSYSKQKKNPLSPANKRRKEKRLNKFSKAVRFAYSQDWPLTIGLTVSWNALVWAGEKREGHCLWRDAWGREAYLRRELARMSRINRRPFVSLWGRDVGQKMGEHVHMSMFWPSSDLGRFIGLQERVTGSSAAFVHAPYTHNPVARSVCGGWQINMNSRDREGALGWAEYIAHQHSKHNVKPVILGKAFGISQSIGVAAQRRADFVDLRYGPYKT